MLYSSDGVNIEHMPVKTLNWSRELQALYSDIQRSLRVQKKPLREWGSTKGGRRRRATGAGGLDFYEELLRKEAGRAGGRR